MERGVLPPGRGGVVRRQLRGPGARRVRGRRGRVAAPESTIARWRVEPRQRANGLLAVPGLDSRAPDRGRRGWLDGARRGRPDRGAGRVPVLGAGRARRPRLDSSSPERTDSMTANLDMLLHVFEHAARWRIPRDFKQFDTTAQQTSLTLPLFLQWGQPRRGRGHVVRRRRPDAWDPARPRAPPVRPRPRAHGRHQTPVTYLAGRSCHPGCSPSRLVSGRNERIASPHGERSVTVADGWPLGGCPNELNRVIRGVGSWHQDRLRRAVGSTGWTSTSGARSTRVPRRVPR